MNTVMFNGEPVTESSLKNFLVKLKKHGDCLLWKGSIKPSGGAQMSVNGRKISPQRFMMALKFLIVPDDHKVFLKCRNSSCCEINHFLIKPVKTRERNNARRRI